MKATTLSAAVSAVLFALVDVRSAAYATTATQEAAGNTQPCSQACLVKIMGEFKASALAKRPVALAEGAEVRENMVIETVAKSAWKDVKAVKSSAVFADALTGNVVSRDGVEMVDGKPAYISTRLKIERGRITEVEFSSDLGGSIPPTCGTCHPSLRPPCPKTSA